MGTAKAKPRGKPFAKGRSGNPHGRPKETQELKVLARAHTVEAINRLAFWMHSDNPRASVAAACALLDRGYGKPAQNMELTGKDGGPIQIIAASEDVGTL